MTHSTAPLTDSHPATAANAQRLLTILRVAWLLLAVALGYFYGRGLVILLSQPLNPCVEAIGCSLAESVAFLQGLRLDPAVVNGLVFAAISVVIPLACVAVAAFIMWRAANSGLALATATTLLLYGLFVGSNVTSVGLGQSPFETAIERVALLVFSYALAYMLHTFPNGRFVPGWGRTALFVEWLVFGVLALGTGMEGSASAVALVVITLLSISMQIYRYRRAASPTERQQIKWGLTGLIGFLINSVLWVAWVLPSGEAGPGALWVFFTFIPMSLVLVLSLPVTLAIAVLRYRLWDIDVLIRRTLIYSVLTAVLTLTYFGLVVVLQAVAGQLTGRASSALVTVLSTLAIAALFAPLRGRVQNFVDRRFYRRKYDTAQTLAAFAMQARDEVNLDQLSAELRGAVAEAMQPAHLDLWLRPGPDAKPAD